MSERVRARRSGARGNIEELPSGALRVRVYAGIDPLSKKRHKLIEVVPPGPNAWREAEDVRDRLVREVAEQRNPRTNATIDQLLERYLEQFTGAADTRALYENHVRNHIGPCLGHLRIGQLNAETLDSFYGQLRRCRTRCTGRRKVDHRVSEPHSCDRRCRPHECQPLAATTIRHIHFILSAADKKAVRWRWINVSPIALAEPPPAPKPNPQPPTARRIEGGSLGPADAAPTVDELADAHRVSPATAKRGLALVKEWGLLIRLEDGQLRVAAPPVAPQPVKQELVAVADTSKSPQIVLLDLRLRSGGEVIARFSTAADPTSPEHLQRLLSDAVKRHGRDLHSASDYELEVYRAGEEVPVMTFVSAFLSS